MSEKPITLRHPSLAWLRIIAVLLLLLVGLEVYRTIGDIQADQARSTRVQSIQTIISQQQRLINQTVSDYQSAAYENPSVERIAEQQLLAAEHTLLALQIIATQNNQVIQLLANTP